MVVLVSLCASYKPRKGVPLFPKQLGPPEATIMVSSAKEMRLRNLQAPLDRGVHMICRLDSGLINPR